MLRDNKVPSCTRLGPYLIACCYTLGMASSFPPIAVSAVVPLPFSLSLSLSLSRPSSSSVFTSNTLYRLFYRKVLSECLSARPLHDHQHIVSPKASISTSTITMQSVEQIVVTPDGSKLITLGSRGLGTGTFGVFRYYLRSW